MRCTLLNNSTVKPLLLFALLFALLGALVACSGEPQPTSASSGEASSNTQTLYEWKMITSWPKNLPALGTSPEHFADIVEKMSNGRMKIRVFGANELVGGWDGGDTHRLTD